MGGRRYCCVVGCTNFQPRNRELTFYSFPTRSWEIEKRNKWIKAVGRITLDNKPWQPSKNTRICSAHFDGGKQSSIENSPAYVPTIFPSVYKKKEKSQLALVRHERLLKRKKKMSPASKPQEKENIASDNEMEIRKMAVDVKELCRLCGKKEECYRDLKDENNKNILKMIQEFIQIPFAEHDELPTKVCLHCEEKIQSFQLFVLECYNVQETLRQMCLESCHKYPIKLEYDIEFDCNNSAIKSEVKHELSDEDLVNANNSDACMTGVDADDCNNDNDDDDSVPLATLKDLKQEKTSERRRMTLTETGMEHLKEISDLNTGDLIECDKRPRYTNTLSAMNKHKKRHKPKKRNGGARKFCCSSCDKVFDFKSHLNIHVQTHLPIEERKLYSCDLCELKFTRRWNIAAHRRAVHDKVKRHVCDECGRAFGCSSKLREHRTVHSDVRPFACRECNKRFKTRVTLRVHQFTHEDNRRHVCAHCGKAFKQRRSLKEHLHSHTGGKPLACEWCDARYSLASKLCSHQQRSHPDKMARTSAPEGYLKDDAVPPKTDVEAI